MEDSNGELTQAARLSVERGGALSADCGSGRGISLEITSAVDIYLKAFADAFRLLSTADVTVWQVIILSLSVSGSAVLIAALVGIPLGYAPSASARHTGRGVIMLLVNTAMGFPPVVIGLFVYMALSRSGPLALLALLYTPGGMVIAQVILATPLVLGVSAAAVSPVSGDLRIQIGRLGASRLSRRASPSSRRRAAE